MCKNQSLKKLLKDLGWTKPTAPSTKAANSQTRLTKQISDMNGMDVFNAMQEKRTTTTNSGLVSSRSGLSL